MNIAGILGVLLAGASGLSVIGFLIAKSRKKELERVNGLLAQEKRIRSQADFDNESMVKYIAERDEIKKAGESDLNRLRSAPSEEKHNIINGILSNLYADELPDD